MVATKRLLVVLLLGVFLSTGCMPPIHTLSPEFARRKPTSIAIMPVLNETVDLDAPKVISPMIYDYMLSKGYRIISPHEVSSLLAGKNIHEAGQVFTLTYHEMGQLLHADSLLFCTVTDWSSLYLLVYSSVSVETKFELIDATSGVRLWEAKYKASKRSAAGNRDSLADVLLNAALSPYEPQARRAVRRCLSTLPVGYYK